ncbi:MAG: MFS transporter [Acidobacteriaceae bacterium]|jgi:MFS family permease|nr:MFS transporter [Acidobacteriaceae bacterium]
MDRGWLVLGMAALAMVGTLPGRTQGLGLVTEPLLRDFGLDRITYATINLWATLLGAACNIPCGRLVDRWGARGVMTALLLLLGLTVLVMAGATSVAVLAVTITLTRGFGQSALSVVSLAVAGKWFARRINFAMGIYALLVGIGFIAAFPAVGQAVLRYGWRPAWLGVGGVLVALFAPLAWAAVREAPPAEPELAGATGGMRFRDALRTPAFWVFGLASAMFGLVYSGIALFNQSILEQRGFDANVYQMVLVVSTLLGLLANFGGGWLAMRWPIQRLMGLGMGGLAVALAALPEVTTLTGVIGYGVAMGVAGGVVTVVFFSVWSSVFGRVELGRIQGAAQMMTVIASAVGPVLLAAALERTGSYDGMFRVLAGLTAALGLACWRVRMPA